jgi:hypothetical protein
MHGSKDGITGHNAALTANKGRHTDIITILILKVLYVAHWISNNTVSTQL